MNRERMLTMLKEGYTPEYVSLIKWVELRRETMHGTYYNASDIGSSTCALCEVVNPVTNGCGNCSLKQILNEAAGYSCTSPWRKVNLCSNRICLMACMTNMINYLQVLVAIYGVMIDEKTKQ